VTNLLGSTESSKRTIDESFFKPRILSFSVDNDGYGLNVEASGRGVLEYQWMKDGVAIEGETGTYYRRTEDGEYSVRVTNQSGSVVSSVVRFPANALIPVKGGVLPAQSNMAGDTVGDFRIGKYEVTFLEWVEVSNWASENGYDGFGGGYDGWNYPVTGVSWYDAVKWCNARSEQEGKTPVYEVNGTVYRNQEGWDESTQVTMKSGANGYRLPLGKEWEWAALNPKLGKNEYWEAYSGSNVFSQVAWTEENSEGRAHVVGGKKPNNRGLYDMSGNAWEWVWDSDGGTSRYIRGGGYASPADAATVTSQWTIPADESSEGVGFRVVLSF
jgi:sulfatase modifying factor 1